MKKVIAGTIIALVLLTETCSAHAPRIKSNNPTQIYKPEISQAFYAELKGEPDQYAIDSTENFDLNVSLDLPDIKDIDKNIIVWVRKRDSNGPGFLIDGQYAKWKSFHEPFSGDNYLTGPERKIDNAEAGTYDITVFNSENKGKYVLIVGSKEAFPLAEQLATIKSLPHIKAFFGKSPWTAYFNMTGVYLLLVIYVLAIIGFIAFKIIQKKRNANQKV